MAYSDRHIRSATSGERRSWMRVLLLAAPLLAGAPTAAFSAEPVSVSLVAAASVPPAPGSTVSVPDGPSRLVFGRDVRPILSDKCFACHGRDRENADSDLRLDLRAEALRQDEEGAAAIVPGDLQRSEVVRRIESDDPDDQMPPSDSHKVLTAEERQVLRQWILEGAAYDEHWSLVATNRPVPPADHVTNWPHNEIDHFVLAQLEPLGLTTSAEADRLTLGRRVSLDLCGLPPSPDQLANFVSDQSADAYEKYVDQMLASPHFGEKMTRIWMDLARYGDTNGYHYDSTRQVWKWRDWVLQAYNDNMPFDQFTIEQLAGDLLPDATTAQQIASGFNRNTRYNEEGGSDPDEFRVRYAIDRTNTLGQVWLGLTLGCAECHDHKYDPISQRDFYKLYAFFNSFEEPGSMGHNLRYEPVVQTPNSEQLEEKIAKQASVAKIENKIADVVRQLVAEKSPSDKSAQPQLAERDFFWIDDDVPPGVQMTGSHYTWEETPVPVLMGRRVIKRANFEDGQHAFLSPDRPLVVGATDTLFAWLFLKADSAPPNINVRFNATGGADGWTQGFYWGEKKLPPKHEEETQWQRRGDLPEKGQWIRLEFSAADLGLADGGKLYGIEFGQFNGQTYWDGVGLTTSQPQDKGYDYLGSQSQWETHAKGFASVPDGIKEVLKLAFSERSDDQIRQVQNYFVEYVWDQARAAIMPLHRELDEARRDLHAFDQSLPFQLVTVELMERRAAHLLMRGNFQTPADEVLEPDVPTVFPRLPDGAPRNRLGLAQWLVDPAHPLVARVTVNRLWAQLFGRGLVASVGDLGVQGEFPSHPELLDWLAVELVESGWDIKHILRKMVVSATYRQSSRGNGPQANIDPANILLWRGNRFRLDAEEVRDTLLSVSGLLSPKVGGPPVFPYQPPKYYDGKMGGWKWELSEGEDRYRRGLYTFWRRTTPYPSFIIFDAPDRSVCAVERPRTNTPLQALATLNDPQFVEAAGGLAASMLAQKSASLEGRVQWAFRSVLGRPPKQDELALLIDAYQLQMKNFGEDEAAAKELVETWPKDRLAAGEQVSATVVEKAASTIFANILLNLDETITRQ
ncbi:MAG: PSD1 and planctomycete cytochrome C domain-containing protein [Pirellulales bacterium]|nr:PSD1 and planctomycete cytochrome C domain-containing protein [Pirellulales bacterium]